MRILASTIAVLMLIALPAQALSTNDILSLVAMPLAVAAVSNLAGVPQDDLAAVVARLNQANVPPVEFVQVVRYVPAALVVNPPQQPTFVEFIDQQTAQGITGSALVPVIDQQFVTTYRLPSVQPVPADTLLLTGNDYVPEVVITRLDTSAADPVALALMPLAVAAVADMTNVPADQLANFVATLNNAFVPPAQFVQVLRYVPVALVADNGPQFVDYVQTQYSQGVVGPALITDINQHLPTYGVPQSAITVYQPSTPPPVIDQNYFPPVVQQRVASANPHGGPPGQLKKQLGLQTGAEVVHGYKPGQQPPASIAVAPAASREEHARGRGHERNVRTPPMISASPAPREREGERGRAGGPPAMPPGQAKKAGPPTAAPAPQERGGHGRGHGGEGVAMPPGQARKMAPAAMPPAQNHPPAAAAPPAMPPGQMKQQGGGEGHGNGHGHGKG